MIWSQVALAYLLDLAVGDPRFLPHPVVMIGRMIAFVDGRLRKPEATVLRNRLAGGATVIVVVGVAFLAAWALVRLASKAHPIAGFAVSILLISSTMATKGLMQSARDVAIALAANDIVKARRQVSMIVGRDTEDMKRRDIVRAVIETVAENSVDAVIAPMIFALVGGAPLAMAYRAINTLDSMIGYKNDKYKDFGWAAARLDDVANYIPARLSVLVIACAAFLYKRSPLKTIKAALRYNRNHASPNSGWPEAAVAGAFDLKLGGTNYYDGVPRKTGFIGDGKGAMTERHIKDAVMLLFISSALALLMARVVIYAIDFALTVAGP